MKAALPFLLGALALGCADDAAPLDPTEVECAVAIERADDIYVSVFDQLARPRCASDDDCLLVDTFLTCDGFDHRPRPIALHVSERALAEAILAERSQFCGRAGETCTHGRSCVEDLEVLQAFCSDQGQCGLSAQGQCL